MEDNRMKIYLVRSDSFSYSGNYTKYFSSVEKQLNYCAQIIIQDIKKITDPYWQVRNRKIQDLLSQEKIVEAIELFNVNAAFEIYLEEKGLE